MNHLLKVSAKLKMRDVNTSFEGSGQILKYSN
jgi:hypothetical protein